MILGRAPWSWGAPIYMYGHLLHMDGLEECILAICLLCLVRDLGHPNGLDKSSLNLYLLRLWKETEKCALASSMFVINNIEMLKHDPWVSQGSPRRWMGNHHLEDVPHWNVIRGTLPLWCQYQFLFGHLSICECGEHVSAVFVDSSVLSEFAGLFFPLGQWIFQGRPKLKDTALLHKGCGE